MPGVWSLISDLCGSSWALASGCSTRLCPMAIEVPAVVWGGQEGAIKILRLNLNLISIRLLSSTLPFDAISTCEFPGAGGWVQLLERVWQLQSCALKVWQCTAVSLHAAQDQGPLRRKQRRPKICQKVPGRVQPGFHRCSWGTNWAYENPFNHQDLLLQVACQAYLYQHLLVSTSWVSRADASCFGHQRFRWNEVYIFSPRCSASAQMIARSISATTFRERLGTLRKWVRKYWNLKWSPGGSSVAERFLVIFHPCRFCWEHHFGCNRPDLRDFCLARSGAWMPLIKFNIL